jgi:hypothetical protein
MLRSAQAPKNFSYEELQSSGREGWRHPKRWTLPNERVTLFIERYVRCERVLSAALRRVASGQK